MLQSTSCSAFSTVSDMSFLLYILSGCSADPEVLEYSQFLNSVEIHQLQYKQLYPWDSNLGGVPLGHMMLLLY